MLLVPVSLSLEEALALESIFIVFFDVSKSLDGLITATELGWGKFLRT